MIRPQDMKSSQNFIIHLISIRSSKAFQYFYLYKKFPYINLHLLYMFFTFVIIGAFHSFQVLIARCRVE